MCSLLQGFLVTLQITPSAVQKLFYLPMMMELISGHEGPCSIHSIFCILFTRLRSPLASTAVCVYVT